MEKDSIEVIVRARPMKLKKTSNNSLWNINGPEIQQLSDENEKIGEPYVFDQIFGPETSNSDLYQLSNVSQLVKSAVEGFNLTIFAYGPTASGKTFTMNGTPDHPGIIPRVADDLFNHIKQSEKKFFVRLSYIEIYNEVIFDLLDKSNSKDIKIWEDNTNNVVYNAKEEVVTSSEQCLELVKLGASNRTIGETKINKYSSRSHSILRIILESSSCDGVENESVTFSYINLIDLAGSERVSQTHATGKRLIEGSNINKSLSVLSRVITQLTEKKDYINYRDSKLTRILSNSLGGNAKTLIICTVNLATMEDTIYTLMFAQRAKHVKLKPKVNEIIKGPSATKRLMKESDQYKKLLESELRKNEELERERAKSGEKISELKAQIKKLEQMFVTKESIETVKSKIPKRRHTMHAVRMANLFEEPIFEESRSPRITIAEIYQKNKELETGASDIDDVTPAKTRRLSFSNQDWKFTNENSDEELLDLNSTVTNDFLVNSFSSCTPETKLRERISFLEREFKELQEFTRLEKQVNEEFQNKEKDSDAFFEFKKFHLEMKAHTTQLQEELLISKCIIADNKKTFSEKINALEAEIHNLQEENIKLRQNGLPDKAKEVFHQTSELEESPENNNEIQQLNNENLNLQGVITSLKCELESKEAELYEAQDKLLETLEELDAQQKKKTHLEELLKEKEGSNVHFSVSEIIDDLQKLSNILKYDHSSEKDHLGNIEDIHQSIYCKELSLQSKLDTDDEKCYKEYVQKLLNENINMETKYLNEITLLKEEKSSLILQLDELNTLKTKNYCLQEELSKEQSNYTEEKKTNKLQIELINRLNEEMRQISIHNENLRSKVKSLDSELDVFKSKRNCLAADLQKEKTKFMLRDITNEEIIHLQENICEKNNINKDCLDAMEALKEQLLKVNERNDLLQSELDLKSNELAELKKKNKQINNETLVVHRNLDTLLNQISFVNSELRKCLNVTEAITVLNKQIEAVESKQSFFELVETIQHFLENYLIQDSLQDTVLNLQEQLNTANSEILKLKEKILEFGSNNTNLINIKDCMVEEHVSLISKLETAEKLLEEKTTEINIFKEKTLCLEYEKSLVDEIILDNKKETDKIRSEKISLEKELVELKMINEKMNEGKEIPNSQEIVDQMHNDLINCKKTNEMLKESLMEAEDKIMKLSEKLEQNTELEQHYERERSNNTIALKKLKEENENIKKALQKSEEEYKATIQNYETKLSDLLKNSEIEKSNYDKKIDQLTISNSELESELRKTIDIQASKLSELIKKSEVEKTEYDKMIEKTEYDKMIEKLTSSNLKLEALEHESKTYKLKLSDLENKTKLDEAEYIKKINQMTMANSKLECELKNTIESYMSKLDFEKAEYVKKVDQLTNSNSKLECELKNTIKSYMSKLTDLTKKSEFEKAEYVKKIDELTNSNSKLEGELKNTIESYMSKLDIEKAEYVKKIDELTNSNSKLEGELKNTIESYMSKLDFEKSEYVKKVDQLISSNSKLECELQNTVENFTSKLSDLTKKSDFEQAEYVKKIDQLTNSNSKLECELKNTIESYMSKLTDLTKKSEFEKADYVKKIDQLTSLNSNLECELQTTIENFTSKLSNLTKNIEFEKAEYVKKIDQLTKSNSELAETLEMNKGIKVYTCVGCRPLKNRLSTLEITLSENKTALSEKISELNELSKNNLSLTNERDELNQQILTLNTKIKECEEKIKYMQNKLQINKVLDKGQEREQKLLKEEVETLRKTEEDWNLYFNKLKAIMMCKPEDSLPRWTRIRESDRESVKRQIVNMLKSLEELQTFFKEIDKIILTVRKYVSNETINAKATKCQNHLAVLSALAHEFLSSKVEKKFESKTETMETGNFRKQKRTRSIDRRRSIDVNTVIEEASPSHTCECSNQLLEIQKEIDVLKGKNHNLKKLCHIRLEEINNLKQLK